MKKLLTILMAGLLIAAMTAPALAWEFSMTGEDDFRFRYWSRSGDKDLFGIMATQGLPGDPLSYTYSPTTYPGTQPSVLRIASSLP